MTSLNHL